MKLVLISLLIACVLAVGFNNSTIHHNLNEFCKADGSPYVLLNNPTAADTTIVEVTKFIEAYDSQKYPFNDLPRACGFCAENLHNVSESKGIRCAIVISPTISHCFNAFSVNNRMIYIDSTGGQSTIALKKNGLYEVTRDIDGCIQTQLLGNEKDFVVFW